ncbi:kinase-like domain-containing protein [Nemania sp. NC0429]|nr:kinase-like domain-containing protein [Nemania sp. NC0429]
MVSDTADPDLIARIYPYPDGSEVATEAIKSSSRYVAPRVQQAKPRIPYSQHERQHTEPPEDPQSLNLSTLPCVELRFSNIPRTRHGLIFGSNPDSDVFINHPSISYHLFTLTYDAQRRLIVKDWGSSYGIEVRYGGEDSGRRSKFQWIVGGHPTPFTKRTIVINVNNHASFRIVVPPYSAASGAYNDEVDRFCKGTATAEDLFRALDMPSRPVTEQPSGSHTLGTGAIHLKKKLGGGSFGVVYYYWNVSTGCEFALKRPPSAALRRRQFNLSAWENEAHIMGLVSHDKIVALLGASFLPYPQLRLEYVPDGSLRDQSGISAKETLSILSQCLSAVAYLHDIEIVHRDIKPDNILVKHRDANYIDVKLADFGLSKDYTNMSTICGSRPYLAPEIYENERAAGSGVRLSYTPVVDIWSLGVVAYELLCDLPPYQNWYESHGTDWCNTVAESFQLDLQNKPSKLKRFLLETMIVISPDVRWPARECYDQLKCICDAEDGISAVDDPRAIFPQQSSAENTSTGGIPAHQTFELSFSSSSTESPSQIEDVASLGDASRGEPGEDGSGSAGIRRLRSRNPSPPSHLNQHSLSYAQTRPHPQAAVEGEENSGAAQTSHVTNETFLAAVTLQGLSQATWAHSGQ